MVVNKMVVSRLIGTATLLFSCSALASTTVWDFNEIDNPIQGGFNANGTPATPGGENYPGNYIEWTQNGITMTLSAWSETINNPDYCLDQGNTAPECIGDSTTGTTELDPFIDRASLAYYQNGENLGISNQDEASPGSDAGSPQHSIDNIPNSSTLGYNDYDMVLAEFTESVNLTGIYSGWQAGDSDVSILAYTGSSTLSSDPFFSNTSTWSGLLGEGWQLVGNFSNVSNNYAISTAIESQYWLIGAYNDAFGGNFISAMDDGFKLGALTTQTVSTTTSVSEPGNAALLSIGVLMLWMRIRRNS